MLREYRQLIFAKDDLLTAFARQGFLSGTVEDLQILGIDTDTINFGVAHATGETIERLALDTEKVLQAMVRYCIDNGVPIPKHGLKSIDQIDGELCVPIRLSPIPTTSRVLPIPRVKLGLGRAAISPAMSSAS